MITKFLLAFLPSLKPILAGLTPKNNPFLNQYFLHLAKWFTNKPNNILGLSDSRPSIPYLKNESPILSY